MMSNGGEEGKVKKEYVKPTVEIVELRVNERIADCTKYPDGNEPPGCVGSGQKSFT